MKTYCKPKQCNIEDVNFNLPAVMRCFYGANGKVNKLGRSDFRQYLASAGIATVEQLEEEYKTGERELTNRCIERIAEQLTENIRNRDLHLKSVRQFKKTDGLSGKERDICQESPEQQVHEYILVHALEPLFKAKFTPFQYGSIPGRGAEMGKRKIERILRQKCKGGKTDAIQGDVRKAYPSTTVECIMNLLKRDIGKNKVLLWYAEAVMSNYPNGALLIGGYFSSYAFNYVMSYVIRYFFSIAQTRRGIKNRFVMALICYADDFVIFGKISELIRAMKKAGRWAKATLGIEFKPAWKIIHMPGFAAEKEQKAKRAKGSRKRTAGIDMMGYVIRATYTIIRKRIFKRMRRQLIRANVELKTIGYIPYWRAYSLMSGKGRIKNSDSNKFIKAYNIRNILKAAGKYISAHAKKGATVHETAICGTAA